MAYEDRYDQVCEDDDPDSVSSESLLDGCAAQPGSINSRADNSERDGERNVILGNTDSDRSRLGPGPLRHSVEHFRGDERVGEEQPHGDHGGIGRSHGDGEVHGGERRIIHGDTSSGSKSLGSV